MVVAGSLPEEGQPTFLARREPLSSEPMCALSPHLPPPWRPAAGGTDEEHQA